MLALVAGLLACTAGAEAARQPVTHTVTIDGAQFSPADLTVKTGDTIVWVNRDLLAHTATSRDGSFDSKVIQPGQSWRFVAKRAGHFAYACSFHPMDGVLKVR
jgi:plastocyanin